MFIEWSSFVLISAVAMAIGAGLGSMASLRTVRNIVIAGACFRIVAVLARYTMIFDVYGGTADTVAYFDAGRVMAEQFRAMDFSIIGSAGPGGREWGTQFIRYTSGLVLAVIGPSMRGALLVFSLAAFVGLSCMAIAFRRSCAHGSLQICVLLLFFWPSLWFWPSTIGKEAILLLSIGLVMLAYVGRDDLIQWPLMIMGLILALAVRPHLAGVLAISMCAAEWASRGWSVSRIAQAALASALAVVILVRALDLLGLAGADLDALQSFHLVTAERTIRGHSSFEATGNVALAIPMAFVNILARPFITEAHNVMALVSSIEMMGFWVLVIGRGRSLWSSLRSWRVNRMLRFIIPFSLLYIVMIGATFQNLGLIARQRTLVMPALLILLAVPTSATARVIRVAHRRRGWQSVTPSTT